MSITVRTTHDEKIEYSTATKWHIDEVEMLHVIEDDGKHSAAFSRGTWASVERGVESA